MMAKKAEGFSGISARKALPGALLWRAEASVAVLGEVKEHASPCHQAALFCRPSSGSGSVPAKLLLAFKRLIPGFKSGEVRPVA